MSTRDVIEAGASGSPLHDVEQAGRGLLAVRTAIVLAVLGIATLVVPWLTRPSEATAYEEVIAGGWSHDMTTSQVDVLFLGNSLVQWGVDLEAFERQTGRRARRLWAANSAGGWWYLVLDRVLSKSQRPPKLLVLCFADDTLTMTTLVRNDQAIDRLAKMFGGEGRHSAALNRLDQEAHSPTVAFLMRHWPLVAARSDARSSFERGVRRRVGSIAGGAMNVEASMDRVFALENKDAAVLDSKTGSATFDPRRYDFASIKDRSFLPDMLDSATAQGVRLVFVRMPRKETAARRNDPEREAALRRYTVDLAAYLEERGYPFIDFSGLEGLDAVRDFEQGDHLSDSGRAIFMPVLVTALEPYLPQPSLTADRGGS